VRHAHAASVAWVHQESHVALTEDIGDIDIDSSGHPDSR
jgi:hypothetical protein